MAILLASFGASKIPVVRPCSEPTSRRANKSLLAEAVGLGVLSLAKGSETESNHVMVKSLEMKPDIGVRIPPLPLISSVNSGKVPNLMVHQFPHLCNGDDTGTHFPRLL